MTYVIFLYHCMKKKEMLFVVLFCLCICLTFAIPYIKLGVSDIHGIGVFAIRDIPNNTRVFETIAEPGFYVESSEIENDDLRYMLESYYCQPDVGIVFYPMLFDGMPKSVASYVNHACDANVRVDMESLDYYSTKMIENGTEITFDYRQACDYDDILLNYSLI